MARIRNAAFTKAIPLMSLFFCTGDTANKIGTYSLALSAFHHNVPFYVAAPLTSIDTAIQSGKEIVIEERSPKELTHTHGGHGTQIAAHGVGVWNPAFDVTPARLITGIITDQVNSPTLFSTWHKLRGPNLVTYFNRRTPEFELCVITLVWI